VDAEPFEAEGYQEVRDVKFGPEGINGKATKDGREWSVTVDSSARVMEQR
jgi:hypothetical protein